MKYWTLAIVLSACGGSPAPATKTPAPPAPVESTDAGTGPEVAQAAPGERLSPEQCSQLFDHVFEIAVASQEKTLPEEEQPTPADIQKAKATMRDQLMRECTTKTKDELHFDCYLKASNRDGIAACDAGK